VRKAIIATIVLALGFLAYVAIYVGIMRPVHLSEEQAGPFRIVAKTHVGPYYKMASVIQEVESWAKNHQLKCRLSFGQYFDDPTRVDENRLQSRGGCILEPGETLPTPLPSEFVADQIPAGRFIKATFDGAPSIGPVLVYPKILEKAREARTANSRSDQDHAWGAIEVYEVHDDRSMTTTYYFPISQ
jgi:hypothetical protein